jgi:hypothetical protein
MDTWKIGKAKEFRVSDLSIPLNGFPVVREALERAKANILSIPLNGFWDLFYLEDPPLPIIGSFNSIEWIRT